MLEIESPFKVTAGTLSTIISPPEFAGKLILDYLKYYNSMLLVSGNFSFILPQFSRTSLNFDVRRAFTAYQLLQIMEEAEHDMLFVEKTFDDEEMLFEILFLGLRDIARRGSIVIVYSPSMDGFMDYVGRNADRLIMVKRTNGGFTAWESGEEKFIPTHGNMTLSDFD